MRDAVVQEPSHRGRLLAGGSGTFPLVGVLLGRNAERWAVQTEPGLCGRLLKTGRTANGPHCRRAGAGMLAERGGRGW